MANGRLRARLQEWANPSRQDQQELRDSFAHPDCVPIAEARDRQVVSLRGTLRTVTLRPRGGVPALEAELNDGTGMVTLVFLGRRRIAGINPGRDICVHGRIGIGRRDKVIYNPRYELIG